jgi:3-hydroxy-3-methylglutaryl CoA synthase
MIGITAFGAYVPRLRLQKKAMAQTNAWLAPNLMGKSKGERAFGNWDEDAITFAVEAARDALGPDDDRSHIKALYFASTTAPFADRLNAGIVQAALTLEPTIQAADQCAADKIGAEARGFRSAGTRRLRPELPAAVVSGRATMRRGCPPAKKRVGTRSVNA